MRAGVRKPKVYVREKVVKGATFTPVYFRWWFNVLVSFFSRIAAVVLLWCSDAKKWIKITVTVFFSLILIWNGLYYTESGQMLLQKLYRQSLVNYRISEEAYTEKCSTYDYEALYRQAVSMKGAYMTGTCRIRDIWYEGNLCFYTVEDSDGNILLVADCRKKEEPRLMRGDTVVFYGEYGGTRIWEDSSAESELPLVYAPYLRLSE